MKTDPLVLRTIHFPTTFAYDANGNETGSSAGEARVYNTRNQTISITGLNGVPVAMGYSDAGQTERTSAGGSVYLNSSLGVSRETKNGQPVSYTRTPRGTLISQRNADGTPYYYLFDGLGSVVGMVAVVGTVVARYGYDPYGQLVEKTGPAAEGNPWRYTAGYWDAGVGLYKLGERYYDPARGRFTQRDPLGGGYVYANDDPVNYVDPSGLSGRPPKGTDPFEKFLSDVERWMGKNGYDRSDIREVRRELHDRNAEAKDRVGGDSQTKTAIDRKTGEIYAENKGGEYLDTDESVRDIVPDGYWKSVDIGGGGIIDIIKDLLSHPVIS